MKAWIRLGRTTSKGTSTVTRPALRRSTFVRDAPNVIHAELLGNPRSGAGTLSYDPAQRIAPPDDVIADADTTSHAGGKCGLSMACAQAKRVSKLIALHGVHIRPKRKRMTKTYSNHGLLVVPNLQEHNFFATSPDRVWASDAFTYLRCIRNLTMSTRDVRQAPCRDPASEGLMKEIVMKLLEFRKVCVINHYVSLNKAFLIFL